MNILICDDERENIEKLEKLCHRYRAERDMKMNLLSVTDYEEAEDFEADLIFLDIEMPGRTGLEIKEELEMNDPKALIIFVTNHTEEIMSAFGTNVVGFFGKPLEYFQFTRLMDKVRAIRGNREVVEIGPAQMVRLQDIRYITMDGIYAEVHLVGQKNEEYTIARKSLAQWEEQLPRDFL